MNKKKLLFIFNPHAGKAHIKGHLTDIVDVFVKRGYDVTVYPTQFQGDAVDVARERAHEFDLLVCSGGDGTLDEVVTGIVQSGVEIPLGYIPAGSTNDFAYSMEIPSDMVEAAKLIMEGDIYSCDIGEFNSQKFVYVAAFGMFSDVSYSTDQHLKNIFGHMAYILEGARRLYDIPSYKVKVEVNGQIFEDDFVFGMVSNSYSVGGMRTLMSKETELNDGEFELMLIKTPTNPIMLNDILANLALPKMEMNSPYIYKYKMSEVKLSCADEIPWSLDGEFGGRHKEVIIKNLPKRIDFMV